MTLPTIIGEEPLVISKQVAKDLKLKPSGKLNMNSASGITEVNTYDSNSR